MAALINVYFTGTLNFKALIVVGNLALIAILFLIFSLFQPDSNSKLILFLPAVIIFFQPTYYEATQWATTVFQNFGVFLFAFFSLLLLFSKAPILKATSLLAAILAALTQGNGVFLFPAAVVVLLLNKNQKAALFWALTGITLFFLLHWESARAAFIHKSEGETIFQTIDYTLCLLGSAVGFRHYYPTLISGACLVFVFCYLTFKKYYLRNPACYAGLLFVTLTAVVNAMARAKLGVDFAYTT